MIEIERIRIKNMLALGDVVIEPLLGEGQTALNGPTGSGKTSVLAVVLFVLYGKTPKNVPVSAMRRQDSTDDCFGEVTFRHDGQTVTVERGLKGKKDSAYARITVDGREQSVGKVTAATQWIINRLGGLDAEGFTTAFIIQQKELDELVTALPSVRRARIERLAGIDRMSAALKMASDEANEVQRRLKVMPGSEEEVLASRAALEDAQQAAIDAWARYEELRDAAEADDRALTEAQSEMSEMDARLRAHQEAVHAAQTARHQADLAAQRAEQADREIARLTEESRGGSEAEVADARAAHATAQDAAQANRDVRQTAERAAADAEQARVHAQRAQAQAERAQAQVQQSEQAAATARRKADGFPADLDEQAAAAQHKADELGHERGALLGEFKRLDGSIKALEATTEACCPTCSTNLSDPAALLETLRTAQARVLEDGKKAKTQQDEAAGRAETLRQQAAEAARAVQQAEHAEAQAERCQVEATQAVTDAEPLAAEARRLAEVAAQAATEAQAAVKATAAVQAALEQAAQVLRRAESAAECAARLPQAAQAATEAHAQAEELDEQAKTLSAAERDARVPQAEAEQVRTAFFAAQTTARESGQAASAAQGDHRVAEQNVGFAEKARDLEEAKIRAREDTFRELEVKVAVREALAEFRRDRIARIAPEVSEVATDLIGRLTEGKYVTLELDEEFTPVVTDSRGVQRPGPMLSGGEKDAVALALRVALSDLISGQTGGLLWADEPFTAQDASRRAAMATTLRELPNRQLIIISHANEATDMVDLVLNVIPDDENGSYIEVASAYGAINETALDQADLAA